MCDLLHVEEAGVLWVVFVSDRILRKKILLDLVHALRKSSNSITHLDTQSYYKVNLAGLEFS